MSGHDTTREPFGHRFVWRVDDWCRWRPVAQPDLLIDPDGIGVYLRPGVRAALRFRAARLLNVADYREVNGEAVWMAPPVDGRDEWRPVHEPSWWDYASLNLPARWHRMVGYLYFTPRPEAPR